MSGSSVTVGSIQVVRRIDDRDAGEHVGGVDPVAERGGGGGELDARVDALGLVGIRARRGRRRGGRAPTRSRTASVRYSSPWALTGCSRSSAGQSRSRLEDVDRGVRLADRELLGRRVARLDDRLEVAVRRRGRSARSCGCRRGRTRARSRRRPASGASRAAPRAARSSGAACRRRGRAPRRRRRAPLSAHAHRVARPERLLLHRDRQPVELRRRCRARRRRRAVRLRAAGPPRRSSRPSAGRGSDAGASGVAERMRVPRPPAMTTAASLGRDSDTVGTLAGAPGFEPGITGPKPVALPLGHAPVNRDAECTRTPGRPGRCQRRSSSSTARATAASTTTATSARTPTSTTPTGTRTTMSCETAATHVTARTPGER